MARRAGSAIEKAHEGVISATMCPVICGVSPWESPLQLYRRKKGLEPPKEQTLPMWLGTQMEPIVARLFTRETGRRVRRPHKVFDELFWVVNDDYGFSMGCLLDGWTEDEDGRQPCEFKTGSGWVEHEWKAQDGDDPNKVPLGYYFQIQHQLAVTGAQRCYVGALIGGSKFYHPVIERDEEIIHLIVDNELRFALQLERDEPPAPTSLDSDDIKRRYPHSEPDLSEVVEDEEVERIASEYMVRGNALKILEDEREGLGNQLRLVLEERESIIVGPYKVSAKEQVSKRVDTKALKVSEPDIWERFAYEVVSRPLRITERKQS